MGRGWGQGCQCYQWDPHPPEGLVLVVCWAGSHYIDSSPVSRVTTIAPTNSNISSSYKNNFLFYLIRSTVTLKSSVAAQINADTSDSLFHQSVLTSLFLLLTSLNTTQCLKHLHVYDLHNLHDPVGITDLHTLHQYTSYMFTPSESLPSSDVSNHQQKPFSFLLPPLRNKVHTAQPVT